MDIVLIAAMGENRVIGRDGGLPWDLPDDLARFMRITRGHQIIMGRGTYESMDGPLPNRRNIVVSRSMTTAPPGIEIATSLAEALDLTKKSDPGSGFPTERIFVIGGTRVYGDALPLATTLDLTRVAASPEGDRLFPEVEFSAWRLVETLEHQKDARHAHAFRHEIWKRLPTSGRTS